MGGKKPLGCKEEMETALRGLIKAYSDLRGHFPGEAEADDAFGYAQRALERSEGARLMARDRRRR